MLLRTGCPSSRWSGSTRFDDGKMTELANININLNDEIRKSMGVVNVGDVKDFRLNVQILTGFEAPTASSSAVKSAAPA